MRVTDPTMESLTLFILNLFNSLPFLNLVQRTEGIVSNFKRRNFFFLIYVNLIN